MDVATLFPPSQPNSDVVVGAADGSGNSFVEDR